MRIIFIFKWKRCEILPFWRNGYRVIVKRQTHHMMCSEILLRSVFDLTRC